MKVRKKNVQRHMTFDKFLYTILEDEADKLGIKISSLVNMALSKQFYDKIELLKLQEQVKNA
jgi:hypothetical protein